VAATPAIAVLDAAGIDYRLHSYDHDPANTHYGAEAADRLGVDPDRLFKTLVVDVGATRPELAVAVVPTSAQLDLKRFAAVLGAKKALMADRDLASRSTGYVLGGVSPLGQKVRLATVVDETAQLFGTVFVSAGRRGLQVELSPDDLAALTAATFAGIAT
jgi:Cys-tRNA(Pro)/Cys-tRNA(Cys) deacylase